MNVEFCTINEWLSIAEKRIDPGIALYQVQDLAGRVVGITPFITESRKTIVLGGDFIPIHAIGKALLEQMVHTPSIYLPKALNIIRTSANKTVASFKEIKEYPGRGLLVGGSPNYYHWLIDYLPRLLMARRTIGLDDLQIIVNHPLVPFQRESLALLGIGESQLVLAARSDALRFDSTVVPSLLASTTVPHPEVPRLLQSHYPCQRRLSCARVYLSRQDAVTRRLTNELELIDLLERFGFQRYLPGELSFQEQIDLCYSAQALVAVHGAGMANIAFCPASATVFEIFTPHHKVPSMFMLSRTFKRKHIFVPAHNVTFGNNGNALLGDWKVDIGALDAALKANLD